MRSSNAQVVPGRAVALGDQPAGNDEGLTRLHPGTTPAAATTTPTAAQVAAATAAAAVVTAAIPFVSVSEREAMVPIHLRPWHVTRHGGNMAASAAVLSVIADAEAAAQAAGACAPLDLEAARAYVALANEGGSLPKRGSEESLA